VSRQLRCADNAAVSGANTVLANPATNVKAVNARTASVPKNRVSAANAGA
jgi:hypothetical protein